MRRVFGRGKGWDFERKIEAYKIGGQRGEAQGVFFVNETDISLKR